MVCGILHQYAEVESGKVLTELKLYSEEQLQRLNAENATLKRQVKLWQSATLMIIASAGAGATILISSPNVLPLTESNAEEISSPLLMQGVCLPAILDAVTEIRWSWLWG